MGELHGDRVPEARLALDVLDTIVIVDTGQRGGRFDRILQVSELVDETELLSLFAEPDAPARDLVDPLDRQVARGGDLADEALVAVLYPELKNLTRLVAERPVRAEVSGKRRRPQ